MSAFGSKADITDCAKIFAVPFCSEGNHRQRTAGCDPLNSWPRLVCCCTNSLVWEAECRSSFYFLPDLENDSCTIFSINDLFPPKEGMAPIEMVRVRVIHRADGEDGVWSVFLYDIHPTLNLRTRAQEIGTPRFRVSTSAYDPKRTWPADQRSEIGVFESSCRPRDLYSSFQFDSASALGFAFSPAFFKPCLTAGINPA